jgi:signal transduction histidine kinase
MSAHVLNTSASTISYAAEIEAHDVVRARAAVLKGEVRQVTRFLQYALGQGPVPLELDAGLDWVLQGIVSALGRAEQQRVRIDYGARRGLVLPRHVASDAFEPVLANGLLYGSGEVRVQVARETSPVLLRVLSEGLGVPIADRPRVFEPFFRGSNVRGTDGVGVGLAIAQYAATRMGYQWRLGQAESRRTAFELVVR